MTDSSSSASCTKRLLIVDDDTGFAGFVRSCLDTDRYSVDCVRDVEGAIEAVESAEHPYDIALIDLWLPVREGSRGEAQPFLGVQLAGHIHSTCPSTLLIGMSQFASEDAARQATGSLSAFVAKADITHDPSSALAPHFDLAKSLPSRAPRATLAGSLLRNRSVLALIAGVVSGALTLLFLITESSTARTSLLVACAVFLLVVLSHPNRRYLRAFWAVLGMWSTAAAAPALGLSIKGDGPFGLFVAALADGPSPVFHVSCVSLMMVLLGLDWHSRRLDTTHE